MSCDVRLESIKAYRRMIKHFEREIAKLEREIFSEKFCHGEPIMGRIYLNIYNKPKITKFGS